MVAYRYESGLISGGTAVGSEGRDFDFSVARDAQLQIAQIAVRPL